MTTYEYLLDRKNNNLPVVPERIVCAANRTWDGIIILGVRHADEMMCWTARNIGVKLTNTQQGFYTNWKRFVSREEAMIIAREQGQLFRPEGTHNPDVLYSECLYLKEKIVYNLPYDYSRCMGSKQDGQPHPTCSDCMRRLSPGREVWQSFISCVPDVYEECEAKISVKQWEERK